MHRTLEKNIKELIAIAARLEGPPQLLSDDDIFKIISTSRLANEMQWFRAKALLDKVCSIIKEYDRTEIIKVQYVQIKSHLLSIIHDYETVNETSAISKDMTETIHTAVMIEKAITKIQDYFKYEGFPINNSPL